MHTRYPQGEGAEVAVEYHVRAPYKILLGSIEDWLIGSVMKLAESRAAGIALGEWQRGEFDSSGRFSEKTTNGNLRLELRQLMAGGPMNLETVNGSVVLGLPEGARADLKVLAMNGDFYSELPVIFRCEQACGARVSRQAGNRRRRNFGSYD